MNDAITQDVQAALSSDDPARLGGVLGELETALVVDSDPWYEHLRGRVLSALGRGDEALAAQLHAVDLDDRLAPAHYSAGVLLAERGREGEAVHHWERAVEIEPTHLDALYNLGQAHYSAGEFERALEKWEAARRLDPDDFELIKKVVQAQRALGRWDDANRSMQTLFEVWQRSMDPAVRQLYDVVVDQFRVAGHRVLAYEMLRPRDPDLYYETHFRVLDDRDQTIMSVQLESSQYGRERGVPYLIGVNTPAGHQSVGPTFAVKPSYRTVKEIAIGVIEAQLR